METTLAITLCVTWMANAYKFMGKDFITALMMGWKPCGRFGSVSGDEVLERPTDEHGGQRQAKALVFLLIMCHD